MWRSQVATLSAVVTVPVRQFGKDTVQHEPVREVLDTRPGHCAGRAPRLHDEESERRAPFECSGSRMSGEFTVLFIEVPLRITMLL
jgi:hypothetical protein